MKNIITSKDEKVLEFLKYLGVDTSLSRNIIITVPLEGPIIVEDTRLVGVNDD